MDSKGKLPGPRNLDDLPLYFDIPGTPSIKVCLDQLRESHLPSCNNLWKSVQSSGDGFGEGEDYNHVLQKVIERSDPHFIGLVMVDTRNSELITIQTLSPSLLCRSDNPVLCSGYGIVNKAYRGHKISTYTMDLLTHMASSIYDGQLGRIVVIGHNIMPSIRNNFVFTGIIPWCTNLSGKGWVHDIISFKYFGEAIDNNQEMEKQDNLPPLKNKVAVEARLTSFERHRSSCNASFSLDHHRFGNISITVANRNDFWVIQDILRGNALAGEGLGLDEFTTDGIYNEKHIRNCCYWIAKRETDGEILAVILTGGAGHTRSPNSKQANGYITVLKSFRGQGLGRKLLEFCESQALSLGYENILTDVLCSDVAALSLMGKLNFCITATIPGSCFVKDHGNTNAYLFWKDIKSLLLPTLQSSL